MRYQIIIQVDGARESQIICAPQEISPEDLAAFEEEARKRETSIEMLILEAATSEWDENDAVQIFEARNTLNASSGFVPWAVVTAKIVALRVILHKDAEGESEE